MRLTQQSLLAGSRLGAPQASHVPMPARVAGHNRRSPAASPFDFAGLSEPVRASLEVGSANDSWEHEAEAVARRVVDEPEVKPSPMSRDEEEDDELQKASPTRTAVRRACAQCDNEEEQSSKRDLRRKRKSRAGGGRLSAETASHVQAALGGGQPLDEGSSARMEHRLGFDFSAVRIHTDARAARAAESIDARAFTLGEHIVFGEGEYQPGTREGQHLLAHELTHVAQQSHSSAGRVLGELERKRDDRAGLNGAASALLVEDGTQTKPGQMTRSEFLGALQRTITRATEQGLNGSGRSAADCPYITRWVEHYSKKSTSHIERAMQRYARISRAAPVSEHLSAIASRVQTAATRWSTRGELSGLPANAPRAALAQFAAATRRLEQGKALSQKLGIKTTPAGRGTVRVERPVAVALPAAPQPHSESAAQQVQSVQQRLGAGSSLDPRLRTRMETALGESFADVRIHTGANASSLAAEQDAAAFTVGRDIVFSSGAYRPGTLAGDALLAHELAHVVQQRGATSATSASSDHALERDADVSSYGAMLALWGNKARTSLRRTAATAKARLRSGLRISRCSSNQCRVRSGPTYSPNGTLAPTPSGGGKRVSFGMAAEFDTDSAASVQASCCWVKQNIRWDTAFHTWSAARRSGEGAPHAGFSSGSSAGTWYEDRDQRDMRYGHRSGPHSEPAGCGGAELADEYLTGSARDQARGTRYCGRDTPSGPTSMTGAWDFQLMVVDVCNGGRQVGATDSIHIDW